MFTRRGWNPIWMGGNFLGVGPRESQVLNVQSFVTSGATSQDIAKTIPRVWRRGGKFDLILRQDLYDELLKIPLRYSLHPFEKLREQHAKSDCGYTIPLGPVDKEDPCPFHVHRTCTGRLPVKCIPLTTTEWRLLRTMIRRFDGDVFRMEEELVKIFPTKRTYVKPAEVVIWGVGLDAALLVRYWLLGLGF